MCTAAILFTKVEKISTYPTCIGSEPLFLRSPDYEQHEMVTNTVRTLKTELINWGEADSK